MTPPTAAEKTQAHAGENRKTGLARIITARSVLGRSHAARFDIRVGRAAFSIHYHDAFSAPARKIHSPQAESGICSTAT